MSNVLSTQHVVGGDEQNDVEFSQVHNYELILRRSSATSQPNIKYVGHKAQKNFAENLLLLRWIMRNYGVPIYSTVGECKKKFITESARAAKTRSFDKGVEHNEENAAHVGRANERKQEESFKLKVAKQA